MKILIIIVLSIFSIITLWMCFGQTHIPNQLIYLPPPIQIHREDAIPSNEYQQTILSINNRYTPLKTLCGDISAIASAKITANLWGRISFEKKQNFRMQLSSRFNSEIDIGSNQQYFWFWSRRMKPSYLYYSLHKDIKKAPLKTLFHPLWMMECLGIDEIDLKGATIYQQENCIAVRQIRTGTMDQLVVKITLIDPKKQAIIGHYLYNDDLKLIASSEVLEFQNYKQFLIPKRIRMLWHEENAGMELTLSRVIINSQINKQLWEMPTNMPKRNLATLLSP